MFELKLIKTESDYKNAANRLDELIDKDNLSVEERNEMELIAHLIDEYEEIQYPISIPSALAAIKFRMDQLNYKQVDLVPYIGPKSKVSDILNGKRQLSLTMIRSLHAGLQIPLEALIYPTSDKTLAQGDEIEWEKFPINKMFAQGRSDYFPNFNANLQQIKSNIEYYLRGFIEPVKGLALNGGYLRQNVRMAGQTDKFALTAWLAACYYQASQEPLSAEFDIDKKDIIINQLRYLSVLDDGPLQAVNFLKKVGIHVSVLRHLPKTHLDGATFTAADGSPVIALTIRYDRVDHFWFTLFHELGHVFLHSGANGNPNNEINCFLDDLFLQAADGIETEADSFASESLITDEELVDFGLFTDHSVARVKEFANQKCISAAIVAGRIRHRMNNYNILSNLVGYKQVRKFFFNK